MILVRAAAARNINSAADVQNKKYEYEKRKKVWLW